MADMEAASSSLAPEPDVSDEDDETEEKCTPKEDFKQDDVDWDEENWQETKDLFSDATFKSSSACLEHMKTTYGFDLVGLLKSRGMTLLDAIKFVNAIRTEVAEGASYGDQDWVDLPVPDDERFLIPVLEADPLLQIVDIDDDEDDSEVPPCPTFLTLLHRDLDEYRQTKALLATGEDLASSSHARDLTLDEFCYRQFDDPNFHGTRIGLSKEEFEWRVNAEYNERCAIIAGTNVETKRPWPALIDGYAPFCKHLFIPNFLTNCTVPVAEITAENEHLLRTGYQARTENELPVLTRWFPKGSVPEPEATYLDIILYSREQLQKEAEAMGLPPSPQQSPWGIISVKAELQPCETPMQPITMMRNALISEGGSGVPINHDAYIRSVEYWSTHAIIA